MRSRAMNVNEGSPEPRDFESDWADFQAWLRRSEKERAEMFALLGADDGPARLPYRWTDEDIERFRNEGESDGQKLGAILGGVLGFLAGLIACGTGRL